MHKQETPENSRWHKVGSILKTNKGTAQNPVTQDLCSPTLTAHCIKTRQNDQLHKPFVSLSCIQKGVTYSSIRIFNALPVSLVKLKTDKSKFKNVLKRFLMYHSFYTLEEFFSNNSDVKSKPVFDFLLLFYITFYLSILLFSTILYFIHDCFY
jgi:hypothetical protein